MAQQTLAEKRNGPGFRDRLLTHTFRIRRRCAVESCTDRTFSILTLYVDAHPPGIDWYSKLLRTIPLGSDTEVGLCRGHATDVIELDDEFMENPDLWEPGRLNPPVMPGPGRMLNG